MELRETGEMHLNRRQHEETFILTQSDAKDDGILSVDNDGVVLLSNQIIQQSFHIFSGTRLVEHFPQLWEQIETTIGSCKPGSMSMNRNSQNFQVTISPVLSRSNVIGAICVFSESVAFGAITQKMDSFKKLSRELSAIVDSCYEGLWICDGNANVMRLNPASLRINNVEASEVIGRNMLDLVKEGTIDRSATLEVLKKSDAVTFLRKTNEGLRVLTVATPIYNDHGDIDMIVVSERDLSEIDEIQKRLEEQSALNDQFQSQILEMQQAEMASTKVIARSPAMVKALNQTLKVSRVDSSVLILGESGTGKGLFADLIHQHSKRSEKPLIKINCGAIPETLIESELFGHEKGAFTGALAAKPGHIELADGGVLFLDEIAELPLASQVKLLHFLEDGKVMRLGGTKDKQVDVRIIAATHSNLEEMVENKLFRLDLYYRLNVIPLRIPPLRDRKDCIVPLVRHYVGLFSKRNGINKRITGVAMDALLSYSWPGNVRQLMNVCERILVMADGDVIGVQDLPQNITGGSSQGDLPAKRLTLQQAVESVERSLLVEAMDEHGNQYAVADVLGISQSTVARKLKRYGIA